MSKKRKFLFIGGLFFIVAVINFYIYFQQDGSIPQLIAPIMMLLAAVIYFLMAFGKVK